MSAPAYQTPAAAFTFIQQHLDSDLEVLVRQQGPSVLPPVLPSDCRNGLLPVTQPSRDVSPGQGNTYRPVSLAPSPLHARQGGAPFMILQVVAVQDISLPLEQRLRALAGDLAKANSLTGGSSTSSAAATRDRRSRANDGSSDSDGDGDEALGSSSTGASASVADSVLQASEAAEEVRRLQRKRNVSARRRWLSFVLTDGYTRVLAVEARPPLPPQGQGNHSTGSTALFPAGVALGSKVKVALYDTEGGSGGGGGMPLPQHSHGVLRLHRENTVLLGGAVVALEVYWQLWAVAQLGRLSGRPAKAQMAVLASNGGGGRGDGTMQAALTTTVTATSSTPPSPPPPPAATVNGTGPSPSAPVRMDAITTNALQQPVSQQNHPQQHQQQQVPAPLQQWPAWVAQTGPTRPSTFLTRAVIERVVSDLLINEEEDAEQEGMRAAHGQQMGAHHDPNTGPAEDHSCSYSLVVAICEPGAVAGVSDGGGDGFTLHVDLGNAWLRQLIGMPAARFKMFSQSQVPGDVEQLGAIIERVQSVLEGLGEAFFTLHRRPLDGMAEVVAIEPVVGAGITQQRW